MHAWQTGEEMSLTWLLMPQLLWCFMFSGPTLYHTSIKLFVMRNLMSRLNVTFALMATRGRHAIIKSHAIIKNRFLSPLLKSLLPK